MLKKCLICGKEFKIPPSRFHTAKSCSNPKCIYESHLRSNRRTTKKLKKRLIKICIYCGKEYEIQKSRENKTKYCGRSCKAKAEKPRYIDGRATYRKFLKTNCEDCKSKIKLQIHHKDKNRKNNNINNLITLCSKCHKKYHPETLFKKGHLKWSH